MSPRRRASSPRPARPTRALGGLAVALLLGLAGAGPAAAQSLLSEPIPQWDVRVLDEPPPEDAPTAVSASRPNLFVLLDMADRGQGREAYPHLLERYREGLPGGYLSANYWDSLRRRTLLALLRAGEGVAEPDDQEAVAREYVERYPDGPGFPLAFFHLTEALYRQGKPLSDSFFFDREALEALPDWMQSRYLIMQAEAAARAGNDERAARFLLLEHELPTTLHETPTGQVLAALARLPDPESLYLLIAEFPPIDWLEREKPLLVAQTQINAGQVGEAILTLEQLDRDVSDLNALQLKRLREAREAVEQAARTQRRRIGVLLPLGSRSPALRELARETLDGLRMAVQMRGPPPTARDRLGHLVDRDLDVPVEPAEPDGAGVGAGLEGFELVVRDTGNSAERAARLVEELAREEHVMAIVGPVARSESIAAMEAAEQVGVPLIAFSVSAEIPGAGRFAFRHNKSREEETRDLVRYAMDYLNARRFAILYPANNYGELMRDLFWDEVRSRGGEVVGVAAFLSGRGQDEAEIAVGLKSLFEQLAGMDRYLPEADRRLIEKVEEDRPDPVVQFDALYIPIYPGGEPLLRLLAAYPATVDAEERVMLGSRHWNNDSVVVAAADKLRGAVFVDAYHRDATTPANQAFRVRHRRMFRHRLDYSTPSLYTALAYDTLTMLDDLLDDPQVRTRLQLAHAIADMEPAGGLTGLTSFIGSGYAIKESHILMLAPNRVESVFP